MRLIFVVSIGFALLALTACSKTQQPTPGATATTNTSSTGEPESHTTSNGHSADGQHNLGGDHADHKHNEERSANGSHHHAHGGHGHSGEHVADDSKHIAIGDKVPDFEVTIDGEKLKLSELQKNTSITEDGTLVLTFWCSFCHSCRHVEHALDELANHYKGKVGIIALDASAGETTEGVAEFAKQRELTLPIALDASGAAADILGTRVTTTTLVIDKSGVLRYRGQFGDGEHAFAQDALQAVLAGEDVPVSETRQKG